MLRLCCSLQNAFAPLRLAINIFRGAKAQLLPLKCRKCLFCVSLHAGQNPFCSDFFAFGIKERHPSDSCLTSCDTVALLAAASNRSVLLRQQIPLHPLQAAGCVALFRKSSRSAHPLGLKRPRDRLLSLPTFCGSRPEAKKSGESLLLPLYIRMSLDMFAFGLSFLFYFCTSKFSHTFNNIRNLHCFISILKMATILLFLLNPG